MPSSPLLPPFLVIGLRGTIGALFMVMGTWKIGEPTYAMGGRVEELFTFLATLQPWWGMVGFAQIAAGALLMTRRFAPLAEGVLFAVTINIAAINIALWPDFGTTMLLTAYALAGLSLLLAHDRHAWMPLLRDPASENSP